MISLKNKKREKKDIPWINFQDNFPTSGKFDK